MSIPSTLERLDYGSPGGCAAGGLHGEVISGLGATRTLLPGESGATVILDRAAGIVVTLPTPVVGMKFKFVTSVSVTSNSYKVITATTASQFLVGGVMSASLTVAASGDFFVADGATHVAITSNGSDTGGLIGGEFEVIAISTTQWAITGVICGSGTNADPFATS